MNFKLLLLIFIRLLICFGILWPLFSQPVSSSQNNVGSIAVKIVRPKGYIPSEEMKERIKQKSYDVWISSPEEKPTSLRNISRSEFWKVLNYSWQEYQSSQDVIPEVLGAIEKVESSVSKDTLLVVLLDSRVWGPEEVLIRKRLYDLKAPLMGILPLTSNVQTSSNSTASSESVKKNDTDFLFALNDAHLPKTSFLGEESIVSLEFRGQFPAGTKEISADIIAKSEEGILSEKTLKLSLASSGILQSSAAMPLVFLKPGWQSVSFEISKVLADGQEFKNSIGANSPLLTATKSVSVLHSKTTILHVGVGPDWNIRSLRQRFKFHPNLDLISYFILRDFTDNMSIPPEELSLIEFPSQKLFGSELENFHGIVAQNFNFEQFMNPKDTANILQYIRNGGRLLLIAGPNSLVARTPELESLLPCKNFDLQLVKDKNVEWEVASNYGSTEQSNKTENKVTSLLSTQPLLNEKQNTQIESQLRAQLSELKTFETFTGCEPKDSVTVFAHDKETKSPLVMSSQFGKGIVLTILASDFANVYPQGVVSNTKEKYLTLKQKEAREYLTNWAIEFVQRRQDGGKRPPLPRGPRVYSSFDSLPVVVQGTADTSESVLLKVNSLQDSSIQGTNFESPSLGNDLLRNGDWKTYTFKDYFQFGTLMLETVDPTLVSKNLEPRKTIRLNTEWVLKNKNSELERKINFPIFTGSRRQNENLPNPILEKFYEDYGKKEYSTHNSTSNSTSDSANKSATEKTLSAEKPVPFLKAYPYYLALLFVLIFIERLLSFFWRSFKPAL